MSIDLANAKPILKEKHLEISFDASTNILYCRWIGFQNKEKIMDGGDKILKIFKEKTNCSKILNDNTEVTGPWQDAAEWTANVWFPSMASAGLKHFAWIFSDNIFAELSAKNAKPDGEIVTTFKSKHEAITWLESK